MVGEILSPSGAVTPEQEEELRAYGAALRGIPAATPSSSDPFMSSSPWRVLLGALQGIQSRQALDASERNRADRRTRVSRSLPHVVSPDPPTSPPGAPGVTVTPGGPPAPVSGAPGAQTGGLHPRFIDTLFHFESSGRPNIATTGGVVVPENRAFYFGLGQLSRELLRQYGVTDWRNPDEQRRAVAAYAADNARLFRQRLNRDPNPGELYLAHQQGIGGAIALLSNPEATAFDTLMSLRYYGGDENRVRRAIENNLPRRLRRNWRNITSAEFANQWIQRFNDRIGVAPQAGAPAPVTGAPQAGAITEESIGGAPSVTPGQLGITPPGFGEQPPVGVMEIPPDARRYGPDAPGGPGIVGVPGIDGTGGQIFRGTRIPEINLGGEGGPSTLLSPDPAQDVSTGFGKGEAPAPVAGAPAPVAGAPAPVAGAPAPVTLPTGPGAPPPRIAVNPALTAILQRLRDPLSVNQADFNVLLAEYQKLAAPVERDTTFGKAVYDPFTGNLTSFTPGPIVRTPTRVGEVSTDQLAAPSAEGGLTTIAPGGPGTTAPGGPGTTGSVPDPRENLGAYVAVRPFPISGSISDWAQWWQRYQTDSEIGKRTAVQQVTDLNTARAGADRANQRFMMLRAINAMTTFTSGTRWVGSRLQEWRDRIGTFLDNFQPEHRPAIRMLIDQGPRDFIAKLNAFLASEATQDISARGTNFEFATLMRFNPNLFATTQGTRMLVTWMEQEQRHRIALAELARRTPPERAGNWGEIVRQYYEAHPMIVDMPAYGGQPSRRITTRYIPAVGEPKPTGGNWTAAEINTLIDGLPEGVYFLHPTTRELVRRPVARTP